MLAVVKSILLMLSIYDVQTITFLAFTGGQASACVLDLDLAQLETKDQTQETETETKILETVRPLQVGLDLKVKPRDVTSLMYVIRLSYHCCFC